MTRRWLLSMIIAGFVLAAPAVASADGFGHAPSLTVSGAVATPTTYSLSQLRTPPPTSPLTTFTVTRSSWWGHARTDTDQGVSVEDLVNAADPTLPSVKNAQLRITIAVTDDFGQSVTFAWGELDSSFGNHPAYLALAQDGHSLPAPELVVPGDINDARSLDDVDRITVAVQNPTATTSTVSGALTVENGSHTTVLSSTELAALPARTLNVSFVGPGGSQQHVETGPTLQAVLRAAHVRTSLNTWVAAVGSDGYVATVTPAEAWVGGRPLLISLSEDGTSTDTPRLVTDGDVKGGRYDSGVVDLVVGQSQGPFWGW